MESLKQQALDYTLGVLPKDESLLFEAMLEQDEEAQHFLTEALDDFANLSLVSKPSVLGQEVRKGYGTLPTKGGFEQIFELS